MNDAPSNPHLDTEGEVDASAVACDYWHPDGPHTPATVAQAAVMVDEMTHYLARATAPWVDPAAVLPHAGDLYTVLGRLRSGLGRLDQVLHQLAGRAENLSLDDTLYDDRGDDRNAGDTAAAGAAGLRDARRALPELIEALGRAHDATGCLGHRDA
ncbi:hypothetical protein [Pseudonocardia sp. HH130630-07]|uniref:hypothetical protein n=1 Tax=Pseudonocardia sp. HH130630-07 TaxID=1690815 RepID=UPI0012EA70AE|nr:hypothetical protein [Pseudonocardia sp. HH130630-07]